MSKQVVRELWEDFERRVIDRIAPEAQRREMRLAFYAGVSALLGVDAGLAQDGVTEDDAVIILKSIAGELRQFAIDYKRGNK